MPRTIRTTGTEGGDREIDALWRKIDELERRLAEKKGIEEQGDEFAVDAYIEVTETDGDPFLTVTGLSFDTDGFEVQEDGSYAKVLNKAASLPADSVPLAIAASSSTGTDTTHYALDDHTHEGVRQITPVGSGTNFKGSVGLEGKKAIAVDAGTSNIELSIDHSIAFPASSPYSVVRTNDVIVVDATSGNFTLNLYQAVANDIGRAWHYIKKSDSSNNTVTINAHSGDTIEGGSSVVLRNKGDATFLVCTATGRWDMFPDFRSTIVARKNSAGTVYRRRRLNLIEGSNVTLTFADDSTDDEIDVTIAASGGGSPSLKFWRMRGQFRNTSAALLDSSWFEEDGANHYGNIYQWRRFIDDPGGSLLMVSTPYVLFWAAMKVVNGAGTNQTANLRLLGYDDSILILNHELTNGSGTVSYNTTTKTITGSGTTFTTDFVVGDYLVTTEGFLLRITAVSSATSMTYAYNPSETWAPGSGVNYQIAKRVYGSTVWDGEHNTSYTLTFKALKSHKLHVLGNSIGGPAYWFLVLDIFDNANLTWEDAGAWS